MYYFFVIYMNESARDIAKYLFLSLNDLRKFENKTK